MTTPVDPSGRPRPDATIDDLGVAVYRVPLDAPESDGTLTWTHATVVVVTVRSGSVTGIGFTYGPPACAAVVRDTLAGEVTGCDALAVPAAWDKMVRAIRNDGRPGVVSMAIAAVDTALWDLAARLRGLPLFRLLGATCAEVPIYGSGGFTSLSEAALVEQLVGWVADGIPRVKMKVGTAWGREPERDIARATAVRRAIGDGPELFVDANGAYDAKQAIRLAARYEELGVTWFEEPVSSDHLAALRQIRDLTALQVAAGEYGYDLAYFAAMCGAGAVDVLQADVSRCAGITEWRRVAALAAGHDLQISGHCAQSLHAHVACSVSNVAHLEYFADHERVDRLLFDGALDPTDGSLRPDPDRPGLGLDLKHPDLNRWRVA